MKQEPIVEMEKKETASVAGGASVKEGLEKLMKALKAIPVKHR